METTQRHDFDLKVFWDRVRPVVFHNRLSATQVVGTESYTSAWVRWMPSGDLRYLGAVLGEVHHETGAAMQPVIETRQFSEAQNPSVDEAIRRLDRAYAAGQLRWVKKPYWRKDRAGLSWLGRGGVQITFQANYEKADTRLHQLGVLPPELSLVKNPELALLPDVAAAIAIFGMAEGWFTGRKLADYFTPTASRWAASRMIINPDDKGPVVAAAGQAFYAALVAAARVVEQPVVAPPDPSAVA